jgi:hypothetical protein
MLADGAGKKEVVAYLRGAALDLSEIELEELAERVLREGPADGRRASGGCATGKRFATRASARRACG